MIWSTNDQWMLTGDHGGFVKYWQSNMNNVKMYQAHKDPIRGLRWETVRLCSQRAYETWTTVMLYRRPVRWACLRYCIVCLIYLSFKEDSSINHLNCTLTVVYYSVTLAADGRKVTNKFLIKLRWRLLQIKTTDIAQRINPLSKNCGSK